MPQFKGYENIGFVEGLSEENNCINYMKKHMELFPDRIALQWATKAQLQAWDGNFSTDIAHDKITFKAFYDRVNRLANGLRKLGIKKNDCVIIFLPMSVELYQSMFAVMQIGAISVFLDSWARRTHLGASADTVNPKAMISFDGAFQFCKEVPEIDQIGVKICAFQKTSTYTATIDQLTESEPLKELTPVHGDHTALITFTTGSSGRPKGANRTHQFLSAQHKALHRTIPYTETDCDLPAFPIFSLNNMASGVTTVIPAVDIGAPTPKDPLILATQMRTCGVNCATLSPSMLVEIARYCGQNNIRLDFLKRVATGGAPISNDDLRNFLAIAPQSKVWVLYGSTEVEPIAHIEAQDILFPPTGSAEGEGVNCGHFDEELEFKFLKINKGIIEWSSTSNWKDLEVPQGEVGEIAVAGLHVCKSYFNYPEATKTTKIIDDQGRVWHRTGDLGYLDSQKQVWLVGRVHNAIQRDGRWLFPVRAEILLKRFDFVKRAAYLGIPDKKLGEKTYAVVTPLNPSDLTKSDEMIEKIKAGLKAARIPADEVLVMEHIPMDPRHHSKVEYAVLREKIMEFENASPSSVASA